MIHSFEVQVSVSVGITSNVCIVHVREVTRKGISPVKSQHYVNKYDQLPFREENGDGLFEPTGLRNIGH